MVTMLQTRAVTRLLNGKDWAFITLTYTENETADSEATAEELSDM